MRRIATEQISYDTISNGIETNREETHRTATEKRSTDKRGNGKEKRRSERQRNGTESLRQDPKRKSKNTAPAESGRKEDNMAKFKVGDRVIVVVDGNTVPRGTTGVIKYFGKDADKGKIDIAIELDRPISYHDCGGRTKYGCGWWVAERDIELIKTAEPEFKLIITSKGDTTTAKLIHGKDVAKEATVTRYSKDEYSEKAAVEAVTKKIFGEDEKKEELFNGKVVCLMDLTYIPKYTKGRVYEFVNGNCKDDYGNVINFRYTLEEMEKSKWFLPIVE